MFSTDIVFFFFSYIFYLQLVESAEVEPTDMEG
jgi:hypothetical protein